MSAKQLDDNQVIDTIVTGDVRCVLLSRLVANHSDRWQANDYNRLDNSLRRLASQHLISYNHSGRAWVRT